MLDRDAANAFRWDKSAKGHYESYFQRANHPTRPLAFWIRYTLFAPKARPQDAVGELWAIYFDGESERIAAIHQEVALNTCCFSRSRLDVEIGEGVLDGKALRGHAKSSRHAISWDLGYESDEEPLLLLPEALYDAPFPKAKALVGAPLAHFNGSLTVHGETVAIEDWVGSQNHNWGSKHTDRYAWGQVAGFDHAPDTFLELSTAQVQLGPLKTPWMSPIVLRHEGHEYRLNAITQTLRAHAKYTERAAHGRYSWHFASHDHEVGIEGVIEAPEAAFVSLPYANPPGGLKTCLNSKLARARVTLSRRGLPSVVLTTAHRAAFEILTTGHVSGVTTL